MPAGVHLKIVRQPLFYHTQAVALSLSSLLSSAHAEICVCVSAQVDMQAGADIDKEVYEWIEHCSAFLVMGTRSYGEDTGNSACTCVRTSNQPEAERQLESAQTYGPVSYRSTGG